MTQLYTVQRYDPIRRLLQSQGLISAAQDREAENQLSGLSCHATGQSTIIDTISDTFVIQLPTSTIRLAFTHAEGFFPSVTPVLQHAVWRGSHETVDASDAPWRVYTGEVYDASPYWQQAANLPILILVPPGYAVVRFELQRAQRTENYFQVKEGEVVLVLRIIELLDPVGPDGVPFRLPEGGDFVQTQVPGRYWRMPLDKARKLGILTPSSFKILEDLYLRGSPPVEASSNSSAQ
ncbi:hypothetical protein D9611_008100 [Ephemerocybe angulata]|uniref:Uncharacterized protein n=1 Tax=Ephemerocybe angulata TaxID=980116 RepID=A0A8H5FD16_9AGAR|nr:hypothetical protein D9611_008100 [Tulosesus angulatus]